MRTLVLLSFAVPALAAVNYEDDVKPIFNRYCLGCHSAGEMRAGLSLEGYQGVLKGSSGGDIVKPGRPTTSALYQAVAHEGDGVRPMPLGGAKIPDAAINIIKDWIQGGLLETAASQPKGPVTAGTEFKPTNLNKPAGAPAMPSALLPISLPEPVHPHPVTALAASPWAPLLAVAGHERIYLYNLAKHQPAGELAFPEGIPYVLRFSRDGATLLAAGGKGVQSGKAVLFDVTTGKRIAVVGQEPDIILAADLSPDGKLVALGGPGKIVKVFSVADGKQLYQIKKHTDWITALEFSPDGAKLASADRAGGIHLWEAPTGGIIVSLSEHKDSVTSLSWRADGRLLASGSEDGQIIIWDAQDGFPAANISKQGGVLSVWFMPDGRLASVARNRTIKIWTSEGKPVSSSPVETDLLTKVTASYDSKVTIAGDYKGRILLWDGTNQGGPAMLVVPPKAPSPTSH
jgi:Planctomycete cytochrome C/WD domain, G-beta repeat